MKKIILLFIISVSAIGSAKAQGGLLDELDSISGPAEPDYAFATFKGNRLVNSQSVEIPDKGELVYIFAHRFGSVENGLYDMFGMDVATMRHGIEYTLPTDFVAFGLGRSTYRKTYDGFVKVKLFRQSKGSRNFPVSITALSDIAITSLRWTDPTRKNYFTSRMSYTHQLLIARKFSSKLSLQLMPTIVHRNLVFTKAENNTFYSMGMGGRFKLTQRVSLNLEYFAMLPNQMVNTANNVRTQNTFAVGFDIETGGHVFQLHFTNARAIYDGGYISESVNDFFSAKGRGIHFGFNITRAFSFKKKAEKKEW